jgi:hypothetical protein
MKKKIIKESWNTYQDIANQMAANVQKILNDWEYSPEEANIVGDGSVKIVNEGDSIVVYLNNEAVYKSPSNTLLHKFCQDAEDALLNAVIEKIGREPEYIDSDDLFYGIQESQTLNEVGETDLGRYMLGRLAQRNLQRGQNDKYKEVREYARNKMTNDGYREASDNPYWDGFGDEMHDDSFKKRAIAKGIEKYKKQTNESKMKRRIYNEAYDLDAEMAIWEERANSPFGQLLKQLDRVASEEMGCELDEYGFEQSIIGHYITAYSLDGNKAYTLNTIKRILEEYDLLQNPRISKIIKQLDITMNESMNRKNKNRLTESHLQRIVAESLRKTLKENSRLGWGDDVWGMFEELKETLGPERLCHEIAGKLDEKTLQMILKTICGQYGYYDDEEEDF